MRWPIGLAAVAYVGWRVVDDWPALAALSIAWRWTVPAFLLSALALGGQVAAWRFNLRHLGTSVPYHPLLRVYYITNLGRYIPGKIWSLAGMIAAGLRLGVPAEIMSASVLLGLVSSLVSGLVVGAVFAHAFGYGGILSGWFLIVPACALAALWPPVFRTWVARVLRLLKRPVALPLLTGRLLYRSVFHYALVWCAYALSIGFVARAVGAEAQQFGLYAAAFPLAYLAGYAALFAPGGWGVREGALVMLAGGGAVALAAALAARLLLTLFEIGLFAYSIWSWRHD